MIEVAVTTTAYIAIIRGTRGRRQVTRISMAQTRLSQIGQINDVIGCPCLGLVLALPQLELSGGRPRRTTAHCPGR
jgi:hypothetical protein